jgi:hypothetical protein
MRILLKLFPRPPKNTGSIQEQAGLGVRASAFWWIESCMKNMIRHLYSTAGASTSRLYYGRLPRRQSFKPEVLICPWGPSPSFLDLW